MRGNWVMNTGQHKACGFYSRNNLPTTPICIFSVTQGDDFGSLDEAGRIAAVEVELQRKGVQYKLVTGAYEGEREHAFIVHAKHEALVAALCKANAQECYLLSDSSRQSFLKSNVDERGDHIGELVRDPGPADALDGYTQDTNGQLWVIRHGEL